MDRARLQALLLAIGKQEGDLAMDTPEARVELAEYLDKAAENEGRDTGPAFTRVYQGSFKLSQIDDEPGLLSANVAELSSFLRLDPGDGGPLLAPFPTGLISAILKVKPALLDQLDVAAIDAAARTSQASNTRVRLNLGPSKGTPKLVDQLMKQPARAKLVGEVVLPRADPARGEEIPSEQLTAVVDLAKGIHSAGRRFTLSNVLSGKQLEVVAQALTEAGLRPSGIDMDFGIGKNLGTPDVFGEDAQNQAAGILRAASKYANGIPVTVTAVATGTSEARRDLFAAAKESDFNIQNLQVSGRDLMSETPVSELTSIPQFQINSLTGAVVL